MVPYSTTCAVITIEPCQYCGNQQVEAPWTLCQDRRRQYAKTLHNLRRNMHWLNRGKPPSSKPVDDGYWEFNIREILAMAMGSSDRPA